MDLTLERAEVLPAREVMSFLNFTFVSARNTAVGVQAVTLLSANVTTANQGVIVITH